MYDLLDIDMVDERRTLRLLTRIHESVSKWKFKV